MTFQMSHNQCISFLTSYVSAPGGGRNTQGFGPRSGPLRAGAWVTPQTLELQAREHPLTPSPCLAGGSLGGVSPRFPIAPRRDGGVFGCPPLGRGLIAGPEHPANPLRAEARFLLESVNSSSTAKNGPRCSRDTLPRTGGDRGRAPGAPAAAPAIVAPAPPGSATWPRSAPPRSHVAVGAPPPASPGSSPATVERLGRPPGRKPRGAADRACDSVSPARSAGAMAAAAAAAMAEQESARNGARNRGGVQRVEGKLRASVEKGDYYEAHQMYRTLFFRYMSQSKHAEARELMCSGALLFFSHGQQNSAADLSMLVLESLEKAEVEVADELLESLAKLFSLMDPNSPERVAFVSRALKWSSGGSGKLGHPRLHQLLALTLWKEQNYCESRYHFLHSSDGEGCANMLVEYSTSRGFRSEVDMFVAQAVLQFLCLKNKSSASVVFTTYTQKHPSIENGPPFVQPLLNFIWFLLLALDGGKLAVFTVLCEQYQPSLRRDPMYNEYLDRIGQLFFGVPPKQTASYGGLLGKEARGCAGRQAGPFLRGRGGGSPRGRGPSWPGLGTGRARELCTRRGPCAACPPGASAPPALPPRSSREPAAPGRAIPAARPSLCEQLTRSRGRAGKV
uniref:Guided entry of tail-anchored proteins factor 4 n=1 Tax=Sus scrofa TaxID=9823 RepID=A0A8D1DCD2_PIG